MDTLTKLFVEIAKTSVVVLPMFLLDYLKRILGEIILDIPNKSILREVPKVLRDYSKKNYMELQTIMISNE